jgi:Skp family chaperone for outer membrane proteins
MLGLVGLGVALYVGKLWADPSGSRSTTTASASKGTRVAIFNIALVLSKYEKYTSYLEEFKKAVQPFVDREKATVAKMEPLYKEINNPTTSAARRETAEKEMLKYKRDMEDIKQDYDKMRLKKGGEQMVIIYQDIRRVADAYAQGHNYDLVLHYNDVPDPKMYWSEGNVSRKMQAGGLIPMYYVGGMDISDDLITNLNAAYKGKR